MSFEHVLIPKGKGTEVTHKVVFSGLLSPLFGRLIGNGIKRSLPITMQGLRDAVESKG